MKTLKKVLLAILGACDVVIYIITPIILLALWINVFGLRGIGFYILFGVGLLATIFRGIKIGWMK